MIFFAKCINQCIRSASDGYREVHRQFHYIVIFCLCRQCCCSCHLVSINPASAIAIVFLNADKHSPASSARSTKRRVGDAYVGGVESSATDRSRSDCVHEQVAKRIANVRFTIFFSPPSLDGAIIADSKRRDCSVSRKRL